MIFVLRLGHRIPRDERISTHVALVARAFGANGIIYSGQHDSGLETSISKVCSNWGGNFEVRYEKNFLNVIKQYKNQGFTIIHLTMYGLPLLDKIAEIKKNSKFLIIVGAERVPGEVYALADHNISVTSQPHSEVAALAILLDRLLDGKELEKDFEKKFKGKLKIKPSERGKEFY